MGSALPSKKLDRIIFASWEYKMHQYGTNTLSVKVIGATSKELKKINLAQQLPKTQHWSKLQDE